MFGRVERHASWILVVIVLFLVGAVVWTIVQSWEQKTTVRLGKAIISASIADSDDKRAKGLSGRDKLGLNDGMLFVYTRDDRWGIWMKEMKFGIDIIWLDKSKRVVHITKNVSPRTYPEVFQPGQPARYVLEVPDGTVEETDIAIGQQAHFDLPTR